MTAYTVIRAMHVRSARRWFLATLVTIGTVAGVIGPAGGGQQPAATPSSSSPRFTSVPSPAEAIAAFEQAEGMVRRWSSEPPAGDETPGAPAAAALVWLRLSGQPIGRGLSYADGFQWGNASPSVVTDATGHAVAEADPRMPVPNDLTRTRALREIARDVTVSLELAGPPVPVIDDAWPAIDAALAPGLDGLIVQVGEHGIPHFRFPSEMIVMNSTPPRVLRGMIANALGEGGAVKVLKSPKELREADHVRMWSFRTVHRAHAGPRSPAVFLDRGARRVSAGEMTLDELHKMGVGLAMHLASRLSLPVDPAAVAAGDREALSRSLALFASTRAAAVLKSGPFANPRDARLLEAVEAACTEALDARQRDASLVTLSALSVASAVYLSQHLAAGPPDLTRTSDGRVFHTVPNLGRQERAVLIADDLARMMQSGLATTFDKTDGFRPGLSTAEIALVTFGAVEALCASKPGATDADLVSAAVRRAFVDTPPDRLVAAMPWLGWAERNLADWRSAAQPDAPAGIPAAIALRQMRDQVWKHQLGFADLNADNADMLGGIVFTGGEGTPLPTWQCIRPLAFIATMLRDPRLTEPAERERETFRLLLALRYLRQLQVDDTVGWMHPDPTSVIGGIRASVWDRSMPLDATSLALLAVCEAIQSLEALEADRPKAP